MADVHSPTTQLRASADKLTTKEKEFQALRANWATPCQFSPDFTAPEEELCEPWHVGAASVHFGLGLVILKGYLG